jgi:hypothetical protein
VALVVGVAVSVAVAVGLGVLAAHTDVLVRVLAAGAVVPARL